MILRKADGTYPLFIGDLQLENSMWQEGDQLPEGWFEVAEIPAPKWVENKMVEELEPIEVDGVWTQNWNLRDMTAEEIERQNAPTTAKAKLIELGLSEFEIRALTSGLVF